MTVGLPQERNCGTMSVHYRLLTTDLTYAANRREIENRALQYALGAMEIARTGITVIPVVVHIVYNSSRPEQNISEAQIRSQIDVLNRDFRKTNSDISLIPAPFQSLAADARIEFVLANTDPNGNPTNGITRTVTTATGFDADDKVKSAATGGVDAWPTDRYLNIWVCQLVGGLLGYAQFPGGPAATDGVVITHTGFGTTGTAAAPFNLGRTATHEIGHWLNLRHIWGDDGNGCNGSDFVADTPNQAGPNTGRPTFPHITCNNGPNGDLFINYMDYSDDIAMFMFTTEQVVRMQATLDNERSSLGTTPTPVSIQGEFYTTDGSGNISLQKKHSGWRTTWHSIVPGNFGGSSYTDLLFYDPTVGEGEFYTTDGSGNLSLLKKHGGWRQTWKLIIPGDFGGNNSTDLLFYDPTVGEGEFYTTDGSGNISLLKKHGGWRQSWKFIIPGNFGGNRFTDLLFYEPTTGEGEFYTTDGNGNISLLKKHSGWRTNWHSIIPGSFGGNAFTDLLFYDSTTGEGEFYTTDGNGNISLLKKYTGWRQTWKQITPGNFGGSSYTDLLFYDAKVGEGEFYTTDGSGNLSLQKQHTGWRQSWKLISPGNFGGNRFTDLLFYDSTT
jgi:hypothetical protein